MLLKRGSRARWISEPISVDGTITPFADRPVPLVFFVPPHLPLQMQQVLKEQEETVWH